MIEKIDVPLEKFKLSVSKAKTFNDCKRKYQYSYIKRLPRKDWEHLTLGSFVHRILELFHKHYLDKSNSKDKYNEVMTTSYKVAVNEFKTKLNKEIKKEAKQIITFYLKKIYSEPFPNIIECEPKFNLKLSDNLILNGFIDIIKIDADGVIHVCDYKTTKDKKYLKNDFFQLLTYARVILAQYPDIKIVRGSYILLRHNFEYVTKEFNIEEILAVDNQYINYYNNIMSEQEFAPNPTYLCNYCDYNNICEKAFNKIQKHGEVKW